MTRRRGLWMSGVATALLFVALTIVDGEIQASGGPGIVAFEVAGSTARVTEILGHWGQEGRSAARVSIALDLPFLVAYATFFGLAVLALRDAARRRGWTAFARPATAIAVLPAVAALFDLAENAGMLAIIEGEGTGRLPPFVTAAAVVKFVALGVAQIYLLAGLAALWLERRRRDAAGESA